MLADCNQQSCPSIYLIFVHFENAGADSSDSFGEHARHSASIAVDRQPPQNKYLYNSNDAKQFDDNQLDLLNSLDYDNGSIISGGNNILETTADSQIPSMHAGATMALSSARRNETIEHGGDSYVDDYNDDSVSDISDISDVFKLNSDILPEMQRSIDWVSRNHEHSVNPFAFVA